MVWVNVVVPIAGGFVTLDRGARATVLIRRAKGTRRSKSPTVVKEALQVSLSLSPSLSTPVRPCVHPSGLYCRFSRLSVCRSVCGSLLSLLPSVRLSVCLSVYLLLINFFYSFSTLSVCLAVSLRTCLFSFFNFYI